MRKSEGFEFQAVATSSDLDAALNFVKKRARKKTDAVEGVSVALFSVMFTTCEGLVDCGLPIENVEEILDQFRKQIIGEIKRQQNIGVH